MKFLCTLLSTMYKLCAHFCLSTINFLHLYLPLIYCGLFSLLCLFSTIHYPPNHLLVEQRYYHSDGSKITLLPWLWQYHGDGSKNLFFHFWEKFAILSFLSYTWFFTATTMVLSWPRKKCNFTSVTVVVPRLYQQMIWRISI